MGEVSDRVILQRLRNRVMESLEMLRDGVSVDEIGTAEVINIWYDYVDGEERLSFFREAVFTEEELASINEMMEVMETNCEAVPCTWAQRDLAFCEPWSNIVFTANKALLVFEKRGRFDEDRECT